MPLWFSLMRVPLSFWIGFDPEVRNEAVESLDHVLRGVVVDPQLPIFRVREMRISDISYIF